MTHDTPSAAELATLLDRHGGDLRRWPELDAMRVGALLETSDAARRQVADAAALDRLLDASLAAPAGIGTARRRAILTAVREDAGRGIDALASLLAWCRRGPLLWRPVVMALIPLVIGFGAGLGLPTDGTSDDELFTELHLLAFDGVEEYGNAE